MSKAKRYRRIQISFTIDPKIDQALTNAVPPLAKSRTVENLISEFLNKKNQGSLDLDSNIPSNSAKKGGYIE